MRTMLSLSLLLLLASQNTPEPFQPFAVTAYRLVNGVAFDGSEDTMYFALLTRDVLAHRRRPDSTAPETNIYVSTRTPSGWSEPAWRRSRTASMTMSRRCRSTGA